MSAHLAVPAELPPWLQRQWSSVARQRGHALLLTGAPGLGQFALAQALARSWLCEGIAPDQGLPACGQCPACHAVSVHTHPDFCVLMPETLALASGWPLDEQTQERIDRKEIKPSKWIRVEASRRAVAFSQLTRSRGHTRVVLVYPAERLNPEAANTLLKSLEEPPGELRFILATEAPHGLLPTLRSRCQVQALEWPGRDEVLDWLRTHAPEGEHRPTDTDLDSWWRAAGGLPERALEWGQVGLRAERWARLPRQLLAGEVQALSDWPVARQLDALFRLCHDLMARRAGAPPRHFAPGDLPPVPSWSALLDWHRQLQAAARHVEHPFHAALQTEAWVASARQALSPV